MKKAFVSYTRTGFAALVIGIAMAGSAAAPAQAARAELYINVAPPPVREEVITRAPGPEENYIWQKGHWRYRHGHYMWAKGHWVARPYARAVWVEPAYVEGPHGWVYRTGRWAHGDRDDRHEHRDYDRDDHRDRDDRNRDDRDRH